MDLDWKVIISTLVGGVITFAATTGQEMLRNRRTRRAVILSVAAEIAAALAIVRARGWAQDIQFCIDEAKAGNVVRMTILLPKDTIPCCRAALSQGALGDGRLTGLVASLVIATDGLKADLDRLFEYDFADAKSMIAKEDPDHAVKLYSEMLKLLTDLEAHGQEAIERAAKKLGANGAWLLERSRPEPEG